MKSSEEPAEPKRKAPLLAKAYPHYNDIAKSKNKRQTNIFYPDGSRNFSDLLSLLCMSTSDSSPLLTVWAGFLFQQLKGSSEIYFEDGFLTPLHKHNFTELVYVIDGQFHKRIEGKDYIFKRGELFLVNQDISHGEYLYRKNSKVLCLRLSNAFFDKSISHNDLILADKKAEEFLRRFILNRTRTFYCIHFDPQGDSSRLPGLFEQIHGELLNPQPGSAHLIIGYVERLLSLLPLDYKASVEWNDRWAAQNHLFGEIRQFLEEHYRDVTLQDLISAFGHNLDFFNRLIKRHTDMTYSAYLQNIRMEKAEILLKTTEFPVEEIARRVGYENLSYFFKLFEKKFKMKPNEMRKAHYTDNKSLKSN